MPTNSNQQKQTGGLKKFFLLAGGGLFTVVVVAVLAVEFLLADKIKGIIVSEINTQVTVPVKVNGGISWSLLKHFPYASVTFKNVSIDDNLRNQNRKLVSVEEISFLCNIFSLFDDHIEFSKMFFRNGELNLYRNEAGKSNFDIIKQGEAQDDKLAVQLKHVQVQNVRFSYLDKLQATDASLELKDILLNGNFNEKNYDLETRAKLHINKIIADNTEFISNKNISANIVLHVDNNKHKYDFKRGKILVEESEFNINGFLVALKNQTKVDFKMQSEGNNIQQLFSLLPAQYKNNFADANGSGQYAISADVSGLIGKSLLPKINVNLNLKDSELKLGAYNKLLKNINATARYEADEKGNNKIVISNFNCTLNNQPFSFKLTLNRLSNPDFDFYANGVLHLSEVSPFIPDSVIHEMEGTIALDNFHLKGRKRDFYETENSTLIGSGEFKLNNVRILQNGIAYEKINGLLKYDRQTIDAQDCTLRFLNSDVNFTGSITNLFPFIYSLSEMRKANDVVLGVNGKLKTQTLDLSTIIETYNKQTTLPAQQKEHVNIRDVFNMKGNVDVEIGKFIFRKMEFNEVKANLQLAPALIAVNNLSALAMNGELRSVGLVSFTPENSLHLKLDVRAIDLDIPKIFNACENFGQQTLTDKNLKGRITTSLSFNGAWKNYKDFDTKSLAAIVDFKIVNGALINFEPLKAASKFISVEELENIRFSDLENTIKIANERIDIPEFEIKSSALNVMFFGWHSFDNNVDYHFKINLRKLLAQKFSRRAQQDAQYIENNPYEGVNLYLSMTGNLSNPKIKYDKTSARNKMLNDFKNEKTVLKNLLKNTPPPVEESERKREEKYFNVKEEPQFLDFDTL